MLLTGKEVAPTGDALELSTRAVEGKSAPPTIEAEPPVPAPTVPRAADWKSREGFVVTEATVGQRTVIEAFTRAGLSRNETARLVAAFASVRKLDRCRPKDSFAFVRDKSSRELTLFEYVDSPLDIWQASLVDGSWVAKKLDLPVTVSERGRAVYLGRELGRSITEAGFESELVRKLGEAFDGHVDLSSIKPGALLRVLVQERRVDGRFAGYDSVDAAEIATAAGPVRIYAYSFGSKERPEKGHFDANARQPEHGGWRMPIPFARITSRFNPKRMHPVLKRVAPHNGVDFAGSVGTPVYSVGGGTVVFAANSGPCGNMVQVQHTGGLVSSYCHLSRFASGISKGDKIDVHELVGYVGATGRVTGPHLHFAVKKNNEFIDPLSLKMGGFRVIPQASRPAFLERKTELDAKLDSLALPASPVAQDGEHEGAEAVYEDEVEGAEERPATSSVQPTP